MSHALHYCLASPIRAFHFDAPDLDGLRERHPGLELVHHSRSGDLAEALSEAELVCAWYFDATWYGSAPKLRAVFTPAAGNDWVARDPSGRVATHYGSFHGGMMAESLLGLMLHFNRRVPALQENARVRGWDRNLQFPGSMLRNQRALLIGYGHVGRECARLLRAVGMEVVGCQRSPAGATCPETGARLCRPEHLPAELSRADQVVLLLPGGEQTNGFLDRELLRRLKPGAHLYNFGRGTTVREADLLWALDEGILAGVGLDVTEPEPLPAESSLWSRPEVFVMPHSSCVYDEYRALHVEELGGWLAAYL